MKIESVKKFSESRVVLYKGVDYTDEDLIYKDEYPDGYLFLSKSALNRILEEHNFDSYAYDLPEKDGRIIAVFRENI